VLVSVIVPVFDEEENIEPLFNAIVSAISSKERLEVIFVDDGSRDGSLEILKRLAHSYDEAQYIRFSRNFGHQAALRAGMEAAKGDCVITMDGDFQHPPLLIPSMIEAFRKGFDIVATKRLDINPGFVDAPSLIKRLTSKLFYTLSNSLSEIKIEPGAADFRLVSKKANTLLLRLKERNLYLRGAIPWLGLPTTILEYSPEKRRYGRSKYNFAKMWTLALDGITSFSIRPLRLTSIAGAIISCIGFLYALYALIMRIFTARTVEGWTSLLISILIIGGIQLISLGILGEYLGKLFMETKGRPSFIIQETSLPAYNTSTVLQGFRNSPGEDLLQ
jgi:dolichol-phosphate mannosyltransferase